MYGDEPLLDSYQNLIICVPRGNESVESIGPAPDGDSVEHAADDSAGDASDQDREGQGPAAGGESHQDEADQASLRPKRKASTTDTYDGGDLGPTGRQIERAKGSGKPRD